LEPMSMAANVVMQDEAHSKESKFTFCRHDT